MNVRAFQPDMTSRLNLIRKRVFSCTAFKHSYDSENYLAILSLQNKEHFRLKPPWLLDHLSYILYPYCIKCPLLANIFDTFFISSQHQIRLRCSRHKISVKMSRPPPTGDWSNYIRIPRNETRKNVSFTCKSAKICRVGTT